jgi:poly(hydroxyalkanoate) granule-associated protein
MGKKKMQEEALDSAHKIWLAGLGALRVAEEEGSKLFRNLVEKGEELQERSKDQLSGVRDTVRKAAGRAREEAGEAWGKVGSTVDEQVSEALRRLGVPTRDEIAGLSRQVEQLTLAVERLRQQEKKRAAKPAAAPAAPKGVKTTGDLARTTSESVTRR